MENKKDLEHWIAVIDEKLNSVRCSNCSYAEAIETNSGTFLSYRSGDEFVGCLCNHDASSHYLHVVDLKKHVCEDWNVNAEMQKVLLARKAVHEAKLKLLEVQVQ